MSMKRSRKLPGHSLLCPSRIPATRSTLRTRAGAAFMMLFTAPTRFQRMTVPRTRAHTTPSAASASSSAGARCSLPPVQGRHQDALAYSFEGSALVVRLRDGPCTGLARAQQFVGYRGEPAAPSVLLLRNNNLHIEIKIDRGSLVGHDDPAGITDIVLEAAVTTIMDLEDSVAAGDGEDKVALYRNWLGLMEGTLTASFEKGGKTIQRRPNPDKVFKTPDGGELRLPGRSLMLIRNVGHHMYTDAVLDAAGREIPEGILDPAVTVLITLRDLSGAQAGRNSRTGSMYIVKPKMHGPDELAF